MKIREGVAEVVRTATQEFMVVWGERVAQAAGEGLVA